jgi:hypothetical protein
MQLGRISRGLVLQAYYHTEVPVPLQQVFYVVYVR